MDSKTRNRLEVAALVLFAAIAGNALYRIATPLVSVEGIVEDAYIEKATVFSPFMNKVVISLEGANVDYWTWAVTDDQLAELNTGQIVYLNILPGHVDSISSRVPTYGISVGTVELRSVKSDKARYAFFTVVLPLILFGAVLSKWLSRRRASREFP